MMRKTRNNPSINGRNKQPITRETKKRVLLDEIHKKKEALQKRLESIYREADGNVPDLSQLQRRPEWRIKLMSRLFFAFCLLLIAGIAFTTRSHPQVWAKWLFVFSLESPPIKLEMRGPEHMAIGEEKTFELQWNYQSSEKARSAEIQFGWPASFMPTRLQPPPNGGDKRWTFGELYQGTSGTIMVSGVSLGPLNRQETIQAIVLTRGEKKEIRSDQILFPLRVDQTRVIGTIKHAERVVIGEEMSMTYVVSHQGTHDLSNLMAHILLPEGFVRKGAPNADQAREKDLWIPVDDLAAHTSKTIEVVGFFLPGSISEENIIAELGRFGADKVWEIVHRTESPIQLQAGDLDLRLVVNGKDRDSTIRPGETISLTLGYQNTTPEWMKDVQVLLRFETFVDGVSTTGVTMLDWKRIEDSLQGASSTKPRVQTIRYGSKQIPSFAKLAALSEGQINVLLPTIMFASGTKDVMVQIFAVGKVSQTGGSRQGRVVQTPTIVIRYRSDASLSVESRYFTEEGAPFGSGPLPPVVGKTTIYRLMWKMQKNFHALQDMQVSAVLPKRVEWTGKISVDDGQLLYDESTRTVRWKLLAMPEAMFLREASFDLAFTPNALDAGRFASLLGETQFQAQDALTGELIVQGVRVQTTDLEDDDGARGKGVVRKE